MNEIRPASNWQAWAIGRTTARGFKVRRVVWGRILARHEKRSDEKIVAARVMVAYEDGRPVLKG